MTRPWDHDGLRARVWSALMGTTEKRAMKTWLLDQMPDASSKDVSNALYQMMLQGYLVKPAMRGGMWSISATAPTPWIRGEGEPAGDADQQEQEPGDVTDPAVNTAALQYVAEACDFLIRQASREVTSAELGSALGRQLWEVETALQPAVDSRHYITCTVFREGVTSTGYRLSSSASKPYDFNEQARATWGNRLALMAQGAAAPAPAVTPVPAPAPAPAPATGFEAWATSPPKVTPPPVFDGEVVGGHSEWTLRPTAGTRIGAAPLPFVGETVNDQPDTGFVCALFSNGKLQLQVNGQVITLSLEHTRQLMHYLDHMDGGAVVSDAQAA